MNYYQYKRRAPRSRGSDYIKPFLVILLFVAIIVAAWKLLGSFSSGGGNPLSDEKVFLNIESGGARAMTSGSGEWKSIPSSIYLYEGERVKTQSDGRITLNFFDNVVARMDKTTDLEFVRLTKDVSANQIEMKLNDGKIWVNNPSDVTSDITVQTGLLTVTSDSGSFVVTSPGMLYVLKGSARADIKQNNNVIKSASIGVGQELIVSESIVSDMAEGIDKEVIFALDDTFKRSDWYQWNQQQDGVNVSVVSENEEGATDTSESEKDEVAADDNTDKNTELTDKKSDTDTDETVKPEGDDAAKNDTEPPTVPKILEPGKNGESITLKDVEQTISGTVSADTQAVIVNDYRLSQYQPGSGKFSYFAKTAYKNLKVGENVFTVVAVDKAGNKSETATITLVLPKDVYDKSQSTEEVTSADETSPKTTESGVKITSPNSGDNLTTAQTAFDILGNVPAQTTKVLVNDYQLQAFKKGDTTFKYKASTALGNLEAGKANTFTVKAYDEGGALLGSDAITIELQVSAPTDQPSAGTDSVNSGAPAITLPTSAGSYNTTLDQIVLGGTVGKGVESVYVNDKKLDAYVTGSGAWSVNVTLTPGENTFTVYGMIKDQKTATAIIKVNYQN